MANDEHQALAQFLKDVHLSLRKATAEVGASQAWQEHCEKQDVLMEYAECMNKLATIHWAANCKSSSSSAISRIQWTVDFCNNYFLKKNFIKYRGKEIDIASKINIVLQNQEEFSEPIKLIDVGSCYNPFTDYDFLDVFAIDLCPANSSVLECDFLKVSVGDNLIFTGVDKVEQLQICFYDVVTFCYLLEYIPSSDLRVLACEKAYRILKPGGLLIINTPDSKHVAANSKTMKCWQYTLAIIGFTRIKYEKLKHMHCMAFRKALHKDIAVRWATLHKNPYMEYCINIPQDFNSYSRESTALSKIQISSEDFKELPFWNLSNPLGQSNACI